MSTFKRRPLAVEVILRAMRRYCRCGINYREPAEVPSEHGVGVHASTICRRVRLSAPEPEKRSA